MSPAKALAYLKEHLRLPSILFLYYLKIIYPTQLLEDKYRAELGTEHSIASICIVYREDKVVFSRRKTKQEEIITRGIINGWNFWIIWLVANRELSAAADARAVLPIIKYADHCFDCNLNNIGPKINQELLWYILLMLEDASLEEKNIFSSSWSNLSHTAKQIDFKSSLATLTDIFSIPRVL